MDNRQVELAKFHHKCQQILELCQDFTLEQILVLLVSLASSIEFRINESRSKILLQEESLNGKNVFNYALGLILVNGLRNINIAANNLINYRDTVNRLKDGKN